MCSTCAIKPMTLRIQPPIYHHWPHTSPSMFVVHCVFSVRVMMIRMERKTIVPLTWFTRQTNLAGTSGKSDDISPEKTEAIDQCPEWIVFAMCGMCATCSLGWRLCWYMLAVTYICVRRKPPGASLRPRWCRFSPQWKVALHRISLPGGGAILNPLPLPSALRVTHNGPVYMFIWIWLE